MTESKEASIRFRKYCISKKKKIWESLILYAKEAKNIERVYDMTTVMQQVQQDILMFAMTNGIGNPDINDAAELIFPQSLQAVVIKVLRPYFLSHWAIFRLSGFNPIRKIDHGIEVNEELYTEDKKRMYQQYIPDFNAFVNELKTGILHANRHMKAAISQYIRELAAALVMNEKAAFGDELRCSMLQEIMESLRIWADTLTMEEAFHSIKDIIYKDVFTMISKNAYEMVAVHFPEKFREIITLKYCLQQTNNYGREDLTQNLIRNAQKRLLVASIDTKTILEAYAACVESLREMDNSCVVMHKVCSVIREYLKRRPDTVQQIITYITSNKKNELEKDMSLQSKTVRSAMMDEEELRGVNDDYLPENMETMGWENWMPNPTDATVGDGAPGRQGVDVFNMLVSVYGSKEMFVKEYRLLLAERLSGSENKDPFFEKRYLDLLKLRFQYSELQHCEVMLRDVMHSQEVDELIEERRSADMVPISSCITSKHYWPRLENETTEAVMPEPLRRATDYYTRMFLEAKRDRKVEIYKTVGCLEVSIELDGVQVDRTIPNIYAHALFLFLEAETWTTNEVVNRLKVTVMNAKKRLEWLVKQGFITMNPMISSDTWHLTRNPNSILPNRAGTPEVGDDDDVEPEDNSEMIDALEQYWGYTKNYIANHAPNGEVKAERMHRVYRMFGSPTSAGPNLDHVTAFLQRKVALGLLTCINGSYRVVKDDGKKNDE
uniref:Anaphase-promoting complex subunit 2 n=1 Tax=Caenorhabditis tropicalis TaxID=1561998 RepID=A0A1I7U3K7_9PELO